MGFDFGKFGAKITDGAAWSRWFNRDIAEPTQKIAGALADKAAETGKSVADWSVDSAKYLYRSTLYEIGRDIDNHYKAEAARRAKFTEKDMDQLHGNMAQWTVSAGASIVGTVVDVARFAIQNPVAKAWNLGADKDNKMSMHKFGTHAEQAKSLVQFGDYMPEGTAAYAAFQPIQAKLQDPNNPKKTIDNPLHTDARRMKGFIDAGVSVVSFQVGAGLLAGATNAARATVTGARMVEAGASAEKAAEAVAKVKTAAGKTPAAPAAAQTTTAPAQTVTQGGASGSNGAAATVTRPAPTPPPAPAQAAAPAPAPTPRPAPTAAGVTQPPVTAQNVIAQAQASARQATTGTTTTGTAAAGTTAKTTATAAASGTKTTASAGGGSSGVATAAPPNTGRMTAAEAKTAADDVISKARAQADTTRAAQTQANTAMRQGSGAGTPPTPRPAPQPVAAAPAPAPAPRPMQQRTAVDAHNDRIAKAATELTAKIEAQQAKAAAARAGLKALEEAQAAGTTTAQAAATARKPLEKQLAKAEKALEKLGGKGIANLERDVAMTPSFMGMNMGGMQGSGFFTGRLAHSGNAGQIGYDWALFTMDPRRDGFVGKAFTIGGIGATYAATQAEEIKKALTNTNATQGTVGAGFDAASAAILAEAARQRATGAPDMVAAPAAALDTAPSAVVNVSALMAAFERGIAAPEQTEQQPARAPQPPTAAPPTGSGVVNMALILQNIADMEASATQAGAQGFNTAAGTQDPAAARHALAGAANPAPRAPVAAAPAS